MIVSFLPLNLKAVHQDTLEVLDIEFVDLDLGDDELDYVINHGIMIATYIDKLGNEHEIECYLPCGERGVA